MYGIWGVQLWGIYQLNLFRIRSHAQISISDLYGIEAHLVDWSTTGLFLLYVLPQGDRSGIPCQRTVEIALGFYYCSCCSLLPSSLLNLHACCDVRPIRLIKALKIMNDPVSC